MELRVKKLANYRRWILPISFIVCAFTCLAYEAIRINGWYNRFGPFNEDNTFSDIAFRNFDLSFLLFYVLVFLPFIVVASNPDYPKVRICWFYLSVVIFIFACLKIPDAELGRWGNSAQRNLGLFYQFVMPLPALIFIVIGLRSVIIKRRRQ